MSRTIFVSAFSGKSKDKGNPFTRVSVMMLDEERGSVRQYDLFTFRGQKLSNQDTLRFGDTVELEYRDSDYPGGRPYLEAVNVLEESPYFD